MRAIPACADRWLATYRRLSVALVTLAAVSCGPPPSSTRGVAKSLLSRPSAPVLDASASAVAAAVLADLRPADLERRIDERPDLIPGLWGTFGAALAQDPGDAGLAGFLAAVARHRADRLARAGPPWPDDDLALLGALQLVDPPRVARDPVFAAQVLAYLPRTVDPTAAAILREPLLETLAGRAGVGYDVLEAAAVAWGELARTSAGRERRDDGPLAVEPATTRLVASLLSFPSSLVDAPDAAALLGALRRLDPGRDLVVLADAAQRTALSSLGVDDVTFVPTLGIPLSPWPRDPFAVARATADGAPTLILRPNLQAGREADDHMGRLLVGGLPERLDRAWGGLGWRRAEVPFHNGQILVSGDEAWISLHTLEPAILERLGLDRVPVADFAGPAGAAYVEAADAEAARLGALLGRRARFVHPVPHGVDDGARARALGDLGGGAGIDLDSVLTLLPTEHGTTALVARLALGTELVDTWSLDELDAFAARYDLSPRGEALRDAVRTAQSEPSAIALDRFLDVVAAHLAAQGSTIGRLPLIRVPYRLRTDPDAIPGEAFLVGWNNVVLEHRDGVRRAEGFASASASGDAMAHAAFARHGYRLDLLPPLADSVIRNGGYRCASQHLRRR